MAYKTQRRRKIKQMTRKNFVKKLTEKLYPSCKHDEDTQKQQNREKYAEHKITYGEMEYEGIDRLLAYVSKIRPNIDTFIDIGSGRGKLCMYMASKPQIKRTLGIELVESRHEDAMHLKRELKSDFADKAEFINSDIFDVDFAAYDFEKNQVLIWFSNLCFDSKITNDIFEKLKQELPVGTIIGCSNTIDQNIKTFTLLDTIKTAS